ncbi:MAG TPA: hypothetical protein VER55_09765 [Ardenticatenaceae bacterium]|nr:hypothetical protein [Ardenticatenaceae bacterium]
MIRMGLLWFDDDKQTPVAEKIAQAARRYREKFGRAPTICFVHPEEPVPAPKVAGLTVQPLRTVLRHHFLVGVAEPAELLKEAA